MIPLPFEVFGHIFIYLLPEELFLLRQCSKSLYFLIGSDLVFSPICRKHHIFLDHHQSAFSAYVKYSKFRKRIIDAEPSVTTWSAHLLGVPYMAKSPKGFISVGWDGHVISHIKSEGRYTVEKSVFCGPVDTVSIPKNSNYAVMGSKGSKRIQVHYIPSKVFFPIELDQPISAIDHSNAYILAAGTTKLFVWDNIAKKKFQSINMADVCFVKFINVSTSFLTVSKQGCMILWSLSDQSQFVKTMEYELNDEVMCVYVEAVDCKDVVYRIFCGFKNGSVRQVEFTQFGFCEIQKLEANGSDWVSSICAIPSLRLVLIGTWDHRLRVHDFDGNLKRVWKLNSTPLSIFCEDESSFIVGGYDGALTNYSFQN